MALPLQLAGELEGGGGAVAVADEDSRDVEVGLDLGGEDGDFLAQVADGLLPEAHGAAGRLDGEDVDEVRKVLLPAVEDGGAAAGVGEAEEAQTRIGAAIAVFLEP